MAVKIILQPKKQDDDLYGSAVPVVYDDDGTALTGLPIGWWRVDKGVVSIELLPDIDVLKHETATRQAIRAELRAAEKDKKGVEAPIQIEFNPRTKRFKQVEVLPKKEGLK